MDKREKKEGWFPPSRKRRNTQWIQQAPPPVSAPVSSSIPIKETKTSSETEKKKEKSSDFMTRDPKTTREALLKLHEAFLHKIYTNPKPTMTLPKLQDRDATYKAFANQTSIKAYVRHYEILADNIYAFMILPTMATVALRLANFRPFFYLSFWDDAEIIDEHDPKRLVHKQPSVNAGRQLMDHLNKAINRPKWFEPNPETKKQAIVDVKLEHLKVGDVYRGVDEKGEIRKCWFYRIHFWNMRIFKHYRELIANKKAGLNWNARMYHEHDQYTQINMLFALTKSLTYCQWVEFNGKNVKWISKTAQDAFGGHSDQDWTDADWENQLESDDEAEQMSSSDSEVDDRERLKSKRLAKRQKLEEKWEKEHFSTACIMEGTIDFLQIKARTDIVGYGPMVSIDFDIETASGRVVKQHLDQSQFPPRPADEKEEPEHKDIPLDSPDMYKELLAMIKPRAITKELEAAEQAIKVANTVTKKESPLVKQAREQVEQNKQMSMNQFVQKRPRITDMGNPNLHHLFVPDEQDMDDEDLMRLDQERQNQDKDHDKDEKKTKQPTPDQPPSDSKSGEYQSLQLWPDPNNGEDPITSIATHLHIYGDKEPVLSVVHGLGDSLPLKYAKNWIMFQWTKINQNSERLMLCHWSHMVRTLWDASIFTTYNGIGYDLPYMAIRAKVVRCHRFFHLGVFLARAEDRKKGEENKSHFFNKRYNQCITQIKAPLGVQQNRPDGGYVFPGVNVHIPGIVQKDVFKLIKGMYKNDTHKLSAMASMLLSDFTKRELAPELITPTWATSRLFRRYHRDYNDMDSRATGAVWVKAQMDKIMTEQSSLTLTSLHDLMFHGQQKKTWNQLLQACALNGWLFDEEARKRLQERYKVPYQIPEYMKTNTQKSEERAAKQALTKAQLREKRLGYPGGYVQNPKRRVYTTTAFTKDFNSLYPSIIIAYKLCPSTWVRHEYTDGGALWFPRYGATYEDCWDPAKGGKKFCVWNLCDLKPDEKTVAGRDLILVIKDWGTRDNPERSIPASRWDAYCLWKKMKATRKPYVPFSRMYGTDETPEDARTSPPPEWKPQEGWLPGLTCCFVVNRECIFPPILEKLLAKRKTVKKLQAEAEARGDESQAKVYEARQLVIKLAANASYGFMGAVEGFHGVVPIAAATCLLGRHNIMLTIFTCLYEYYGPSIYGDTDSTFATYNFLGKLPANGEWKEARMAKACIQRVLQFCSPGGKPFEPSADYKSNLAMDSGDITCDYNGDMPLDKKQLEGPAKDFIAAELKKAKESKNETDVIVWLLVQARAEIALNSFYMGRKERGEKVEKAKKKGKTFTNPLIPDIENIDWWRLLAMKVQADAAAEEVTARCPSPMKIENEKIILRIALFAPKMYGYRQILPKLKSDTRGLGTVRKDVPPAIREAQSGALDVILDCPLQDIDILVKIMDRKRREKQQFLWKNEPERLQHVAARNKVLLPIRRVLDRLIAPKLNLDDWQRTVAKPDRINNVKTQTVIAIAKDEKRRQMAYEKGQRVTVLVTLPKPLPKVTMSRYRLGETTKKDKDTGDDDDAPKEKREYGLQRRIRYQLSGLYRNTEVRSYVEQNHLKLHRAYYHQAIKKKALTTCSVVLMPEEVEEAMYPYLLQIYEEDFHLTSLTKSGFKVVTHQKHPMMSSLTSSSVASLDTTTVTHEDEESEDEKEEGVEGEEKEEFAINEYGNNDIGLDLAEH